MSPGLSVLLRKEALELGRNKRLLVYVLAVTLLLIASRAMGYVVNSVTYIVLMMVIVSQYMFDSCNNDIQSGGALFLLNTGSKFSLLMLAKLAAAALLTGVLFASYIFLLGFGPDDLILAVATLFLTVACSYCAVVLTGRSDFFAFLLTTSVLVGVLEGVRAIAHLWMGVAFVVALGAALYLTASVLYHSKRYREML